MDDPVLILLMKQFSSVVTTITSPLWLDRLLMGDVASGILKH